MLNVKIGRYSHPSVTEDYAGWIEPEDRSWIVFLGPDGTPAIYYPVRDATGGVVGEGIPLDSVHALRAAAPL